MKTIKGRTNVLNMQENCKKHYDKIKNLEKVEREASFEDGFETGFCLAYEPNEPQLEVKKEKAQLMEEIIETYYSEIKGEQRFSAGFQTGYRQGFLHKRES
jgi:hypothetical protein